jgi:hypothetical protein
VNRQEQYDFIVNAAALQKDRLASFRAQYTEQDANRLADAYIRYPWVNPQILVSTVLSGQDDTLPMVAEFAAQKMAEAGVTPADTSRRENRMNRLYEDEMYRIGKDDPDGARMYEEIAPIVRERLR